MNDTKEIKPKNIYTKVQAVRVELLKANLKKSGRNNFSNFSYYELGDFLPKLNELMEMHGITTMFSMTENMAVLQVVNSDKPEEAMILTSPTAEVEIGRKKDGTGGAEPIQNLGGKITYMRRYLLMMAFEVVESDYIDKKKQDIENIIDEETQAKINSATDLDELGTTCKGLKAKLEPKYVKSLLQFYTLKKEELINANPQS